MVNLIADAMLTYRQEFGLSQAELGKLVGLSGYAVWETETGIVTPRIRTIVSIAQLVQWTVEEVGSAILNFPPVLRRLEQYD